MCRTIKNILHSEGFLGYSASIYAVWIIHQSLGRLDERHTYMLTLTYLSLSLSFRLALFHYHTLTIPVFCVSRRMFKKWCQACWLAHSGQWAVTCSGMLMLNPLCCYENLHLVIVWPQRCLMKSCKENTGCTVNSKNSLVFLPKSWPCSKYSLFHSLTYCRALDLYWTLYWTLKQTFQTQFGLLQLCCIIPHTADGDCPWKAA